ncbi:sister chromatid separation protein-like protein [Ophiobolus disseminans]|uniref:Sister chromatid separation protein-like protein n=1 Tax=Ophiobolus disseminans TaxID=1469910 RepID=A0A6A6ZQC2_9PLEO|nr:sister chromatid separation protein-like protein [Ophiobolus disseminans]
MADARGEYWYFDPDVDANKITVPELRSILLKHGVTYPSSAKKPVLVSLFNDAVAPQAAQVQRAHARTKRTTRGIQDVPSSSASTVTTEDTEDDTLVAPPSAATRRTSRRTMRGATEEREEVARAPRGKTPTRAVPAKHSRAAEVEADERPAVRRPRKSAANAVRAPSPDPAAWHRPAADSPFTQENPFQSGSSPPAPDTRDRRRRTMGNEQKERRRSEATRRKTFQPNVEQLDEGIVVPTRGRFNPRIHRDEPQGPEDAGEEFTPEEQLELVRENAKAGKRDILPPRRRKHTNKAAGTLKAMSGTLLLTAAAVLGGAWRQEKIAVGFCGLSRDSTGLAHVQVPEWAGDFLPQCEPCPPHAQCLRDLQLTCDPDFIRKDHPLSLNGLLPIPPTCEPDSEKTRKVNSVADRGVQFLRERRAQYECGEPDAEGNTVESPDIGEAELKQRMTAQKSKGITDQEFHELFDRAWPEMTVREEVVESTDGTSGGRQLSSTSLAKLSLACSARRSLRQSLERYLLQIVMIVLVIATGSYGKYSFTHSRAMEVRAKQLAGDVFDQLANHAALSMQEPGAYPDKGLSMAQLRDDVLRTEFSTKRRKALWERVQKKVEFNSNVRAAVRQAPSGDVARMWEWTGPLKLLESGRSSSGKRESGRFRPSYGTNDSPSVGANQMQEVQRWDEGRPIY